ncbi:MAG TPA: hypothetical protein PK819_01925 [Thermomicrobiales bacterium]|nr:hypothetical protein [Thermomicrobiales bacterium]
MRDATALPLPDAQHSDDTPDGPLLIRWLLRSFERDPWTCTVLWIFLLAMAALPTLAPVAISDDWTYTASVRNLIDRWQFHILPVAAATQITQLFWGGAFGFLLGTSDGVMRLSTLVIVLISGCAFRAMLSQLGIPKRLAAATLALYLFNPIMFSISYTFMSDPHFVAWMTIAVWLYVKAEVEEREELLIPASALAALACLQRPHGALIPLGVATWYLVSGRLRIGDRPVQRLLRIGALPAIAMVIPFALHNDGLPSQQKLFLTQLQDAPASETWLLLRRMAVIETMYFGLFALPLVFGCARHLLLRADRARWWQTLSIGIGWMVIGVGGMWMWNQGKLMPYIPHFLGKGGPGSGDVRYTREPLFGPSFYMWFTIACGIAAGLVLLTFLTSPRKRASAQTGGAGIITAVLIWQAIGVLPQSFLFRNWIISLDRYLLPTLPLLLALLAYLLRDVRFDWLIATPVIALVMAFSIAGTRDILVFHENVWALARALNRAGVADTRLDAGYAWDAAHLWEFSYDNKIPAQTPDGSWWTSSYAQATDSTYVISGKPVPGYDVLSIHEISGWLQRKPVLLFVLRRTGAPPDGVTWPP